MDSMEWTDTCDLWSPRGIHGHTIVWTADMRPVESTGDPWTYSSMDSLHEACGHGRVARWAWVPVCHHVGQRGNQGWEI